MLSKLTSLSLQPGWELLRERPFWHAVTWTQRTEEVTSGLEGWAEAASVRVVKIGAGHIASVRVGFLTQNMGRTLSAP